MTLANCFIDCVKSCIFRTGLLLIFILATGTTALFGQVDREHYSKSFKASRPYRIYLPESYQSKPAKRYPVVYYFHGNNGTHQLPFPGVTDLVNKADVILV